MLGRFVPAATQRLVQIHLANQLRQTIADQGLLRAEQLALGVEEGQVAVDPDAVAALGQAVVILVGADKITLRLQLVVEGLPCCQAVGDFLKGRLDGFFITGDVDVFLDFRVIQAGLQRAGIEDRQADLRLEQPGTRTTLEQAIEVRTQGPGIGGQADAGEECRACGTDVGILGLEQVLGLENVRAPLQQVRWQTGRYVAEQLGIERLACGQVVRQAGAKQQHQKVAVLGDQALVLGQLRLGVFDRGTRLAEVQRRSDADFITARCQLVAFFEGLQGFLGQLVLLLVGLPGEVGIGDTGDQADLCGATGFFARQVDLQGLLAQAANAAEQVDFISTDAQGCRILAGDCRLLGLGHVGWHPLACTAAIGRHRREQVRTLDAVLRPVGIDVQRRDAQIAVVGQGGLDQLLQGRVMEKLTPALLGCRDARQLGRLVGRAGWPLRGYRRFRALVVRYQRTAAQNKRGNRQGQ
ncbi:hypothetical protein D9M73_126890 [compost metagenome]